jgi:hypothetical protein
MKPNQARYGCFRACALISVQTNLRTGGHVKMLQVAVCLEGCATRVRDTSGTKGHVIRVQATPGTEGWPKRYRRRLAQKAVPVESINNMKQFYKHEDSKFLRNCCKHLPYQILIFVIYNL